MIIAYILPTHANTLIPRTNFMTKERVIINYRDGLLNLDGILLGISEHSQMNENLEFLLANSTNYCNMVREEINEHELRKEQLNFKIKIKEYIKDLPQVVHIPNLKHEIRLRKYKIIYKKPFPVPLNIRKVVQD